MKIETVSILSYESRVHVCLRVKTETESRISYESRNCMYSQQ